MYLILVYDTATFPVLSMPIPTLLCEQGPKSNYLIVEYLCSSNEYRSSMFGTKTVDIHIVQPGPSSTRIILYVNN